MPLPGCWSTWRNYWKRKPWLDRSCWPARPAARHFPACCPAGTAALSALRPPDCLSDALCREIAETLAAAEESPRLTACAALRRLAALCEAEADEFAARAHDARRLWPRLGGCLGVLAAILLW